MTIRICIVLALLTGVLGAFIGHRIPRDVPTLQATPSAHPSSSVATPNALSCKAERAELASTKVYLAICLALSPGEPENKPSGVPEVSDPKTAELKPEEMRPASRTEEIRRNRERLDSYSEAVIVQHHDGSTGVYKPDEWPIDGDGVIVARKLPGGELGWYAGPEIGPRSDPAAFRTPDPTNITLPAWGREPDGTITIGGKPASPSVQLMFGGKVDDQPKPQR